MTLHRHKVDDSTIVNDGQHPLPVPAGWRVAEENEEGVYVCSNHPWQSDYLAFASDRIAKTACADSGYSQETPICEFRLRL
jgi:hypothetical protein